MIVVSVLEVNFGDWRGDRVDIALEWNASSRRTPEECDPGAVLAGVEASFSRIEENLLEDRIDFAKRMNEMARCLSNMKKGCVEMYKPVKNFRPQRHQHHGHTKICWW